MSIKLTLITPTFQGCKKFVKQSLPIITPIIESLSTYEGNSNINNTVYVNGLNFLTTSIIEFNGQPCDTFYNTPRQIFFYVPLNLPTGSYPIRVNTQSIISNQVEYFNTYVS